jgi:hypothetical protein
VTATLAASLAAPASRIRTVLLTAARGAALIGLAVVVGIVLLQVVDNPTGGSDGDSSDTTSATDAGDGNGNGIGQNGTTDGVSPSDVSVVVLNASGVQGAAQAETDVLAAAGYATLTPGNADAQTGITVACSDATQDALQPLIDTVGQGATPTAFPAQTPTGAENADCIVFLGTVTDTN